MIISQPQRWEIKLRSIVENNGHDLMDHLIEFVSQEREVVAKALIVQPKKCSCGSLLEEKDREYDGEVEHCAKVIFNWDDLGWNSAREEQIRMAKEMGINVE